MKLHLPRTLLAVAFAASGLAGSHALAVATGTYTATCSSDPAFLHNYTFTNNATGATGAWSVVAANNSEAILHFTANSCTTANTVAQVQYSTFSAGGFIVDDDTNVSGIGANGTRNFILGHAGKTSASQINRNFELSPNNGLALAGTQTWTVADNVTFSLEDSAAQKTHGVTLNGSLTLDGAGSVDFTSQTLSGGGSVTVSSGTLKNAAIASGVTLALGENVTLSGVTMSGGSVLDLTRRDLTSETPLVASSGLSISEGVTISLSGVTAGSTVKISDTALNGINFIINGEEVVAARSTITQENGTFAFVALGHVYSDMVWAGGASGTWNTTDANWTSAASGSADPIAFANDDSVIFNTSAAVTVAEGVTVGGMSVTGADTVLDLAVSDVGYVRGDVTVSDGSSLVLKTKTDSTGLIRGSVTVNVGSTLQFDDKDVTGYGTNADDTLRSIRIEEGAQFLLNHSQNETFRGQLTLNGTMRGIAENAAIWDLYGNAASLVVEAGKNARVENVTLRLRQNDTRITVNENAVLTVASITKHGQQGNGIFKKLGSGTMNVTGSASFSGFSLDGGSLAFTGGGSLGNIMLTAGGSNLSFAGAAGTTYAVGTLTAGTGNSSNHFDRNMTIAEGVTVNAGTISTNWGMGVITVNGTLNLSTELKLTSGDNRGNLTTANIINGSGSVVTALFTTTNVGTYKIDVANFAATTSSIGRNTTISSGNVNLGATALNAQLLVNNGHVTIASTSGSGTLTAAAGTITLGGGSHSFGSLDISNNGASTAQVTVLTGGNLTATTLRAGANSSILLEEGATFTSGDVVFSGMAAEAPENMTKVQADENAQYAIGSEHYTISNAVVTVNSANATTIGNKLLGGSLANVGAGEVTATNGGNNLDKIEARGGDINLQGLVAQSALDTLVIAEGKTVAAHTNNDPLSSIEHEAALVVTNVAAFGQGATLNANLDLRSGVTLTLDGALQMGSSLTLHSGMTLAGDKLAELGALTFGNTVELFTGVDTLVLDSASYTMGVDTLGEADAIDLHTYFSNVQAGSYYLGYNASGVVYAGRLVPEPATTTLGLLALAGLCARRRRK